MEDDTISIITILIRFELPMSQGAEGLYCVVTRLFYIAAATIKTYFVSYLNCA